MTELENHQLATIIVIADSTKRHQHHSLLNTESESLVRCLWFQSNSSQCSLLITKEGKATLQWRHMENVTLTI